MRPGGLEWREQSPCWFKGGHIITAGDGVTLRERTISMKFLLTLLVSALALTACAYVRPNPTPPNFIHNGPGDPYVTRLGGPDSGVIFRYP